jgi:hypothetical protein
MPAGAGRLGQENGSDMVNDGCGRRGLSAKRSLTGPALALALGPRAGMMALPLDRRPIPERRHPMWFSSRSRSRNGSHAGARALAPRFLRRRVRFRPQTEALDQCYLLSFGKPIATTVTTP